jgi:hypothetical protein
VVECDLAKVEVAGSNPVSRSIQPDSFTRNLLRPPIGQAALCSSRLGVLNMLSECACVTSTLRTKRSGRRPRYRPQTRLGVEIMARGGRCSP